MNSQNLRIIDANLDRATEGLRVLEDIARFTLDDINLSARLKAMRHAIHQSFPHQTVDLISARDSAGDIGRKVEHQKEPASHLADTVVANARRVEQSLRVLEEISRVPGICQNGLVFEEARYAIYAIEKEILSRLNRSAKAERLKFYKIAQNQAQLSQAVEAGAQAIQLERGTLAPNHFYDLVQESKTRCAENDVLLIVEDSVDIALAANVDGVALDEFSLPISVVRKLLKIDRLIGYAAKSPEEAVQAQSCGADYILCPEVLNLEISTAVNIPVVSPVHED
ncbi:thiamine-phosphate pyrophosphorylase [Dehalogenimonas formicexedens]|uniref:Thiamine-phosphate pyrophosphorylase n=1 Tax=Dehalogenimonas formicexedens TaxID=1839801 RepID=A0A1P8F794_9CHLR|nr:thiamine phosphate synthase [Dehalogenimonas formicexedens]APV44330.1 thiamine-phosphate pyrophosphorylase [Dehalogenimonas formicexedens]